MYRCQIRVYDVPVTLLNSTE